MRPGAAATGSSLLSLLLLLLLSVNSNISLEAAAAQLPPARQGTDNSHLGVALSQPRPQLQQGPLRPHSDRVHLVGGDPPEPQPSAAAPQQSPRPRSQISSSVSSNKAAASAPSHMRFPPHTPPPGALVDDATLTSVVLSQWNGTRRSHLPSVHPASFHSKIDRIRGQGWFRYAGTRKPPLLSSVSGSSAKAAEAASGNGSGSNQHQYLQWQQKLAGSTGLSNSATGSSPFSRDSKGRELSLRHGAAIYNIRDHVRGSVADRHAGWTAEDAANVGPGAASVSSVVFLIVGLLAVICAIASLFVA